MTRVFFVDDEEEIGLSVARGLPRIRPDFVVAAYTDPRKALASLRTEAPDVLITDLRMEGLTGLELLVASRESHPDLPAVVVTAYGSPAVREEISRRGSIEYLEKPFSMAHLAEAIDAACRKGSGFSGAVAQLGITDLVQMYALARFSGALRISCGQRMATLWFDGGEMIHAKSGALEGAEAVYLVLGWSGGSFEVEPDEPAPRVSIHLSWQQLLLEGCRLLDEESRPDRNETKTEDSERSPHKSKEKKMANVKESLEQLSAVDGFMGACVVDSNSGMMLGAEGGSGSLNLEVAAAGNTEVVRAKRKTMKNLGIKGGIEDILITLDKQYHLIKLMGEDDALFVYLVLDKNKSNLAMARHQLGTIGRQMTI